MIVLPSATTVAATACSEHARVKRHVQHCFSGSLRPLSSDPSDIAFPPSVSSVIASAETEALAKDGASTDPSTVASAKVEAFGEGGSILATARFPTFSSQFQPIPTTPSPPCRAEALAKAGATKPYFIMLKRAKNVQNLPRKTAKSRIIPPQCGG
jgi:hypothetical protein